jgi:type I restriction enzyme, S subunit
MHQSKVPQLRFKDCISVWDNFKINQIFSINPKQNIYSFKNEKIKSVDLEHLDQGTGILLGHKKNNNDGRVFKKGQVLFGRLRPYLKKYWLSTFDGNCSGEIWVLDGKKVDNIFLFYVIQTEYFNHLANVSSGTRMPRADWNYIKSKQFFIPTTFEQTKIASFLTSVDSKIEKLTRKKELLEEYKKGSCRSCSAGKFGLRMKMGIIILIGKKIS